MRLREIITEDIEANPGVSDVAVIFGGRFQPVHKGHYAIYKHLVDKFGRDRVWIATSDKTDKPALDKYAQQMQTYQERYNKWEEKKAKAEEKGKEPPSPPRKPTPPEVKSFFNFEEKKKFWTNLFGVPENRVVFSAVPAFQPKEVLEQLPEDTAYVAVTSQKDKERYEAKNYFLPWPDNGVQNFEEIKDELYPYKDKGYYEILPMMEDSISASKVRSVFQNPDISEEEKKEFFTKLYGEFDEELFSLMNKRLGGEW